MKNHLRLIGAFFLLGFFLCARAEVLIANEVVDYSINFEDIKHKGGIVLNSRNDHPFPVDVLDEKDKSIRFKNVQEDSIPLFSLMVSLVSLVAAFGVPLFLDKRNRKKSVVDDFWARQVIYPEYIKPVLIFKLWVADVFQENLDDAFSDVWNSKIKKQNQVINELGNMCPVIGLSFDRVESFSLLAKFQDAGSVYIDSVVLAESDDIRRNNFNLMCAALDAYQLKMLGFLSEIQNQR